MSRAHCIRLTLAASICLIAACLHGCGGGDGLGPIREYVDVTMTAGPDGAAPRVLSVVSPLGTKTGHSIEITSGAAVWLGHPTHELTAPVYLKNRTPLTIKNVNVEVKTVSDPTVTNDGPWSYGTIASGATTAAQLWTFFNPNDVNFTFTVRITWTT